MKELKYIINSKLDFQKVIQIFPSLRKKKKNSTVEVHILKTPSNLIMILLKIWKVHFKMRLNWPDQVQVKLLKYLFYQYHQSKGRTKCRQPSNRAKEILFTNFLSKLSMNKMVNFNNMYFVESSFEEEIVLDIDLEK